MKYRTRNRTSRKYEKNKGITRSNVITRILNSNRSVTTSCIVSTRQIPTQTINVPPTAMASTSSSWQHRASTTTPTHPNSHGIAKCDRVDYTAPIPGGFNAKINPGNRFSQDSSSSVRSDWVHEPPLVPGGVKTNKFVKTLPICIQLFQPKIFFPKIFF